MKDNQTKYPKLRFKGFTDPWEERKLGDLATSFEYGLNASAKEFDGIHKYIRITDIDDSSRKFDHESLTSPDIDLSSADNYKLQYGDILFARTGASVGKTYIYSDSDGLVYYAGFLIRARIKSGVDSNFIFQHTLTSSYENFIRVTSQRSGQPGVNAKEYSIFEISVPSYEEQQRIGSFFKQLDNTTALHQRKLAKLKELKQSYLQKLFPKNGSKFPQLRFTGFADAWEQRKLGELGKIYTGNTPKTSDLDNWTDNKEGHIWITPTDIDKLIMSDSDRHLSEQGWSKARKIPENSVLITSIASIGKNTINAVPVAFNQQINAIVPEKNDSYFILSAMIKDTARFASVAGQTATAIINKTTFEKFQIATPSYEEQQKIGSFFTQLDNTITLHQRKLEKLQELKKGYLQKMFC
ncbi:restriction endonuclease subunit S (plasmid) [Pediococcus pentosaceus]